MDTSEPKTLRPDLDSTVVLRELAKVAGSRALQNSQRRRDLLTWLVRVSLDHRGGEITERAIAAGVFGKSEDFEPIEDSIVRVEISRLRAALETYYSDEGRNDPIFITIPKRTYIPEFLRGADPADAEPGSSATPALDPTVAVATTDGHGSFRASRRPYLMAVVTALLVLISWVVLGRAFRKRPPAPEFIPVTSLPGRQTHPSLSPDGSRLAFSWDAEETGNPQIFVKPVEGASITRLTSGTLPSRSPAWSPDGNSIAFLRNLPTLGQEVRLIPAKGGAERVLTSIHTVVQGIAWTPDSRYLVVPDGASGTPLALFLVSLATGDRRQLTGNKSYFYPDVSPDGSKLTFQTDGEPGRQSAICVLSLGQNFLPAGQVQVLRQTAGEVLAWPTWSPDGDSVMYSKQLNSIWSLQRVSVADGQVQLIPETGVGAAFGREISTGRFLLMRRRERYFLARIPRGRPLGDTTPLPAPVPLFQSVEQDQAGALSRDGRKIAFISHRGGKRGLWIADGDGSRAVCVEEVPGYISRLPSWSPDGLWVYYWGLPDGTAGTKARIFRVCLRSWTSQAARLKAEPVELDGADNMKPSISRDGLHLYFASQRSGSFQILRAPVAGGSTQAMTPLFRVGEPPNAEESSDGEFLYYSSDSGIWKLSLKDGKREMFLPVGPGGVRVATNGIYYDTLSSIRTGTVYFQPFAAGSPVMQFRLGEHRGWCPIPGEQGLLASMVRVESNIELYTAR